MTVLTFLIETLVLRHYGLAAVFITPLALLLVEAGRAPPWLRSASCELA